MASCQTGKNKEIFEAQGRDFHRCQTPYLWILQKPQNGNMYKERPLAKSTYPAKPFQLSLTAPGLSL